MYGANFAFPCISQEKEPDPPPRRNARKAVNSHGGCPDLTAGGSDVVQR